MKALAVISALFLTQPAADTSKQSVMPNLHQTSDGCGSQPQAPAGCAADSAKCVNGQWQWTC